MKYVKEVSVVRISSLVGVEMLLSPFKKKIKLHHLNTHTELVSECDFSLFYFIFCYSLFENFEF